MKSDIIGLGPSIKELTKKDGSDEIVHVMFDAEQEVGFVLKASVLSKSVGDHSLGKAPEHSTVAQVDGLFVSELVLQLV